MNDCSDLYLVNDAHSTIARQSTKPTIAILSAACIACFLSSSPALLWGWLALPPVPALVALAALPVRSNRLELYGDRLVVVYAGMRSVIPYAHVRGVRRTRTLWAGTANSLDRVYIEAPYDGDAIVSVTDNDALVAELGHRCGLGPYPHS